MINRIKNDQNTKQSIIKIYVWFFISAHRAGCHQRADRSFFYKGYQFPMCARCTGVMIGYLIAIPIYFMCTLSISTCIFLCAIMFIDWYIQYTKLKESSNIRRLVTGICGGVGLMSLQIMTLVFIIYIIKQIL